MPLKSFTLWLIIGLFAAIGMLIVWPATLPERLEPWRQWEGEVDVFYVQYEMARALACVFGVCLGQILRTYTGRSLQESHKWGFCGAVIAIVIAILVLPNYPDDPRDLGLFAEFRTLISCLGIVVLSAFVSMSLALVAEAIQERRTSILVWASCLLVAVSFLSLGRVYTQDAHRVEWNASPFEVTSNQLVRLRWMYNLKTLNLAVTQVSDDQLKYLQGHCLDELNLGGTPVSDTGLAHLRRMDCLSDLNLSGTLVTDAGLVHLRRMERLLYLGLNDTEVTDAGLAHIKHLSGLTSLYVGGTSVSDAGIRHIKELQNLRHLGLSATKVSDAGMRHMKELQNLRHLGLSSTNVSDACLVALREMTELEEIWLHGTKFTPKGLAELQLALPACQIHAD